MSGRSRSGASGRLYVCIDGVLKRRSTFLFTTHVYPEAWARCRCTCAPRASPSAPGWRTAAARGRPRASPPRRRPPGLGPLRAASPPRLGAAASRPTGTGPRWTRPSRPVRKLITIPLSRPFRSISKATPNDPTRGISNNRGSALLFLFQSRRTFACAARGDELTPPCLEQTAESGGSESAPPWQRPRGSLLEPEDGSALLFATCPHVRPRPSTDQLRPRFAPKRQALGSTPQIRHDFGQSWTTRRPSSRNIPSHRASGKRSGI